MKKESITGYQRGERRGREREEAAKESYEKKSGMYRRRERGRGRDKQRGSKRETEIEWKI